ncbi:LysR family transcriptional regulator [Shewanella cyperi]|uniref:LysR family transcriptional regulator n=1 Tax=Shewanella cyperi TaxID=2814292 RepID=A0A974XMF3_9GAMM|nr:LysR family transcriptional regulator [Shewanella cyperi]QSX31086.1 LysR family transcriptional regulator [Shewanella cyperi]QSX41867.1 LysR family transcriptional regulator [Shewanella cyperi]
MNPEHLKLFVRIAGSHNISQAGESLGLSPAVASAHMAKLEQELGIRLLHRTTRQVSLTEEGKIFLPHAEEVLTTIESAKAAVGVGHSTPSGMLRITAPASFGRQHLIPAIAAFLRQNPLIRVDFNMSDTIVDLVEGGFDVAIRNAELKDSSLIARRLTLDKRIVCAAPAYLQQYGEPQTPQALVEHSSVCLRNLETWSFVHDGKLISVKTHARMRTDNGEAMRDACCEGVGLAINSTWNAYRQLISGELVQVLKDYPLATEAAIWAVYPSSRLVPPKVRAFIDFLLEWFGEVPYWDRDLALLEQAAGKTSAAK